MNVLKALASIISMCNLNVILLSKITPRYFTDASVPDARIFILLQLGGALTNGTGAAVVNADWVALASLCFPQTY
jgi:hypothetical protein